MKEPTHIAIVKYTVVQTVRLIQMLSTVRKVRIKTGSKHSMSVLKYAYCAVSKISAASRHRKIVT
jgi:hypothetical protein